MSMQSIQEQVCQMAEQYAKDRHERQRRRVLDPADIVLLKEAGFYHTGIPVEQGGVWENVPRSTRPIGEILRTLAGGDASLALVSAMCIPGRGNCPGRGAANTPCGYVGGGVFGPRGGGGGRRRRA